MLPLIANKFSSEYLIGHLIVGNIYFFCIGFSSIIVRSFFHTVWILRDYLIFF
jgi:hypothetical protein